MRALITSISVAALLFCGQAVAQDQAKEEIKKEETVPKSGSAGGQTMPDQNSKQEGSSKIPVDPATAILVDGRLTVPGAADGDAVPSNHSARTFADDQLPIAAYATRNLSQEQLQAIRGAVKPTADQSGSRALGGFAEIGAIVPTSVALEEMQLLPDALTKQIPSLATNGYVLSENKILLVNPRTRVVIGLVE
jgi:hypothetical protein